MKIIGNEYFKNYYKNMKKTTTLSILTVLLFCCLFFSMTFKKTSSNSTWRCDALKYTYQIKVHTRGQVQLPISICEQIENARKATERTEIEYSKYITIVVFSSQEIQQLDTTLQEIKYESK